MSNEKMFFENLYVIFFFRKWLQNVTPNYFFLNNIFMLIVKNKIFSNIYFENMLFGKSLIIILMVYQFENKNLKNQSKET